MKKKMNTKSTRTKDTKENSLQQGVCLGATDENWKMLATAILISAIKEYRIARKHEQKKEIQALEEFFRSEWCNALVYMSTGKGFIFNDNELDNIVKRSKK